MIKSAESHSDQIQAKLQVVGSELHKLQCNFERLPLSQNPKNQYLQNLLAYTLGLSQDVLTLGNADADLISYATSLIEFSEAFLAHPPQTLEEFKAWEESAKPLWKKPHLPPQIATLHQQFLDEQRADNHNHKPALSPAFKSSTMSVKTAAALAALLLIPSEKIQFDPAPNFLQQSPVISYLGETSQHVNVTLREKTTDENVAFAGNLSPSSSPDRLPNITHQVASLVPDELLAAANKSMTPRIKAVLQTPETRNLVFEFLENPQLGGLMPAIAVVESNANPKAKSGTAMGVFQDRGGLDGFAGNPTALRFALKRGGLLPELKDKNYQTAKNSGPHALLKFLVAERKAESGLYSAFEQAIEALVLDPQTGALLANFYHQALTKEAIKIFGLESDSPDAPYLGALTYNAGAGNARRAEIAMSFAGVKNITTTSVLNFLNSAGLEEYLEKALNTEKGFMERSPAKRKQKIAQVAAKLREAMDYTARVTFTEKALNQIVVQPNTAANDNITSTS